ncbi:DNA alkylation repair protein [Rhizobium lentis]|uniref:DNA alkylation repair protein n=1 Tax=Rhizobium lentis TaxID=1138194 RepID=A0A9Q3MBP7_9HYPH|nr:DNA alkylation repair protein [Rhizobium lentis]MBX4955344.1 DNA alkylation repair protein [Rhizobium lentis]MBX4973346.1 DNA alkylation repair protein [Rhizobium lentis]MBX4984651.1 DNA alkylation repair protein [Rhizobium lentis]MBX4999797.1 DNA alkylation repair protein [Rhizobium lentis]MBX5003096.1 DNA alkylation repair protein [Rhizobium lentis]
MPEPLKNLLHEGLARDMSDRIAAHAPAFDRDRFVALATDGLAALELMERSALIRDALFATMPRDFPEAAAILKASLPVAGRSGLSGWMLLPVNQFIAARGPDHFDLGLDLLKALTRHFTAEYGIRPFIHRDQQRALAIISGWVGDPDQHVRRLASEGTRPRLPWAMRLPQLVKEPAPILPILTALMDDPEDYVRRSVANSLNDIAKDHPDMVAAFIAGHIEGASAERRWLLKHASRTLLKKGHAQALANFGFGAAASLDCELRLASNEVIFGDGLDFEIRVTNSGETTHALMIDYAIHHVKADGSLSPKVFKCKTVTLAPGQSHAIERRHAMRPITTRRYYPGEHRIAILVNGVESASQSFVLRMPSPAPR